jgi:hypothetical protein
MAATIENNPNVLRKLSRLEWIFDEEVKNKNAILPRIFLVDIPDVQLDLGVIKKACVYWAKRHPFLRAEILRNQAEQSKYFVRMNEEVAFKFENVKLYDESNWEQVLEADLDEPFDLEHGHLWTLKVVRVDQNEQKVDFNYAFIFKTQHSITDGRNAYEVFRQYLNILGSLLENKTCTEMDESVVEDSENSIDQLALRHFNPEALANFKMSSDLDRGNFLLAHFS